MNVSMQVKHGVLIVRPQGEIDVHTAEQFRREIEEYLAATGVKNVLLSLKDVTFIDSSGIGVILGRYRMVQQWGGRMAAAASKPTVARIFALSGLVKVIKLYRSEAEALENI